MGLQLRNNIHWCNCAGRAIFLDLEADRYFCLPAAANATFLRLAAGTIQGDDPYSLRMLVFRRVLVEGGPSAAIGPPPGNEPPARDWPTDLSQRAGLLSVLEALFFELRAAFLIKTRGLRHVLEAAARPGSKKPLQTHKKYRSIRAIVRSWSSLSFLARVEDRCLVRALAVHAICKRKGIAPRLVFGVIAHPFAAHCWVQLENAVLVGGYEQARLYTPILVIE